MDQQSAFSQMYLDIKINTTSQTPTPGGSDFDITDLGAPSSIPNPKTT